MDYRAIERVAYRTVLLAATLVLLAFAFRQLVTLAVAVLATVMLAILLSGIANPLQRHGVPRAIGALIGLLTVVGVVTSGMDVVDKIKKGDQAQNGTVSNPDKIVRMRLASDAG